MKNKESWRNHFELNQEELIYGTNAVDIIDYGIFNSKGEYENLVKNSEPVTINQVNIRFHLVVQNLKRVES